MTWMNDRTLKTLHLMHASYILHLTYCILQIATYTLDLKHCIFRNAFYTNRLTHCVLHIALTHYILHITSYTLHLTHCILHIHNKVGLWFTCTKSNNFSWRLNQIYWTIFTKPSLQKNATKLNICSKIFEM